MAPEIKRESDNDVLILTEEVLDIASLIAIAQCDQAGAISTFLGTTRDTFESKEVVSLEYEAYEDMALDAMKSICSNIRSKWGDEIKTIVIAHKLGACPVGHTSVFIGVSSKHRTESLHAIELAINELKAKVPIWKKEIYAVVEGSVESKWKENKEFEPQVPTEILTKIKEHSSSLDNLSKLSVQREKDEAKMMEKEKIMLRKSACDALAAEGGESIFKELDLAFGGNFLDQKKSQSESTDIERFIDEIGVIMLPDDQRTLVCTENKLGIPIGAMKPLFAYAIQCFHNIARTYLVLKKDQTRKNAEKQKEISCQLMSITRAILVVRGDMPSALNKRKSILLEFCDVVHNDKGSISTERNETMIHNATNALKILESEISLLNAIFTLHPKSPSAWSHRRWVLAFRYYVESLLTKLDHFEERREGTYSNSYIHEVDRDLDHILSSCCSVMQNGTSSKSSVMIVKLTQSQLEIELQLCDLVNRRYLKNYYGWTHRIWLLSLMSNTLLVSQNEDNKTMSYEQLLVKEQDLCKVWLLSHTSDHCAANYYIRVFEARLTLSKSMNLENNIWSLFATILDSSANLIVKRPGSEALWYLRRGIVSLLAQQIKKVSSDYDSVGKSISSSEIQLYCDHSILSINGPISPENIKSIQYSSGGGKELRALNLMNLNLDSLSCIVQNFVAIEMCFVRCCMQNIDVWNFQQQRGFSLRYSAHLLRQIVHEIVPTLLNSNLVENRRNLETFKRQLISAISQVCEKLRDEDIFVRGWNYLRRNQIRHNNTLKVLTEQLLPQKDLLVQLHAAKAFTIQQE